MNPAPSHNRHEPTEDGSEIYGNTTPDFRYYEDLNRSSCPRQIQGRGIAEGDGSSAPHQDPFYLTFRQQEQRRYENLAWSSLNIQDVGPELREEPTPLFPEARNSGSASSSASGQLILLDMYYMLPKLAYGSAYNSSYQYHPMSLQQPPALVPVILQLPAASTVAWNNYAPLQHTLFPVQMTPLLVQPFINPALPQETFSSYTNNPYQCPTIPIPSRHEGLPITDFGTKEMISSTKTSEMLTHTTRSFLPSTSKTLSTDNIRSGWELMKPLSNKTCKEKQSSQDPNVSGKSSRNGSAYGARSKETFTASGTSASERLKKFSQLSVSTKGGGKQCGFCTRNEEKLTFARNHALRNSETGILECPVLRKWSCEVCGITGDFAHTRSYCPRIRMQQGEVKSIALAVLSTKRRSDGKERKYRVKN
jgi:rubrerythrin